jgi:predicted ATPase
LHCSTLVFQALESSPRDVRLLVSVGDLHLTSGDVEAARNVYETALSEGQSTSEDAITEVLRTPVQVALSAAHRGLAWCALAKQAPNALIVAAKQLKLAIAACECPSSLQVCVCVRFHDSVVCAQRLEITCPWRF